MKAYFFLLYCLNSTWRFLYNIVKAWIEFRCLPCTRVQLPSKSVTCPAITIRSTWWWSVWYMGICIIILLRIDAHLDGHCITSLFSELTHCTLTYFSMFVQMNGFSSVQNRYRFYKRTQHHSKIIVICI